ncbi:hypothetical protein ABZZ20_07545 [Streptomyces sp. NPDC006430]|uniref:hypothetical protein n=1 Tax=Streptomyces sp. NPDC006430 TaxID=3154299 RepID=UPI0033B1030C
MPTSSTPSAPSTALSTPSTLLTDRAERALAAAAENRISEPLRLGAALARLRRVLARRTPAAARGRESLSCQSMQPPSPLTR